MTTVLLITLTLAATNLELDATVRHEDRAGLMATGPATASVPAADFELYPRLLLGFATPLTLTTIAYGPRLFYRLPNPLAKRPLVLHQGELALVARLSPVWTLSFTAYLHGGEVDYSRAMLIFDARTQTPALLPDSAIIRFLNTGAVATLDRALSEQAHLSSGLQVTTSRPLGDAGSAAYPTQNRVEITEQYVREFSAQDVFEATLSLSETWYLPGPAYTSLAPLIGWRRRLDVHQELTLHLGALVAATNGYVGGEVERSPNSVSKGLRLLPIIDGAYSYEGRPSGHTRLRGEVTTGITGFFEPVRAVVEPRVFAALRGELSLSAAAQLRAAVAFYTSLDYNGTAPTAAYRDPFPTVVYGNAAWRQVWSENITTEVGARANSRVAEITSRHVAVNQPEIVGYVALTATAELME